eukprot:1177398-Prorocentrum_minimum.AAC.3
MSHPPAAAGAGRGAAAGAVRRVGPAGHFRLRGALHRSERQGYGERHWSTGPGVSDASGPPTPSPTPQSA